MTGPTERADHRACRVRVYVHEARPALPHLLHAGRTQRSWPERSWRRTSNPSDVSPRGLAGQGRHARLDSAAETRHSSIEVDHPLSLSIRPRPERRAHRTTPGETRRCIPNRGSGVHRPIGLAAPESVIWVAGSWPSASDFEAQRAGRLGSRSLSERADQAASGFLRAEPMAAHVSAGGSGGGVAASRYHPSVTAMAAVSGSPRTPM
jgi:hypothetical protein